MLDDRAAVVAVVSNKGGVGKTTTALALAGVISAAGARVLLVDLDQQTASTTVAGAQVQPGAPTVFDVVAARQAGSSMGAAVLSGWNEFPEISGRGGVLSILPGDPEMQDSHVEEHGIDSLALAFRGAQAVFDVVILDCPPLRGAVVQAALAAADRVVFVTEAHHMAVRGLGQSWRLVEDFNAFPHQTPVEPATPAGVLITKYDSRRVEHRAALAEVQGTYGSYAWVPPIPERAAVQSALAAHYPLNSYPERRAREAANLYAMHAATLLRSYQDPILGRFALAASGGVTTVDVPDGDVALVKEVR